MGSERRKKTRVSQDRTARERERERERMEDDGCETTMRNYAIDPVKESHGAGLLRESLLDKSVRKWNGEPRSGKISTFVEARRWGPIWKRKGRPLVSRILVSRGIWTDAAACGNSGRPRWESQGGVRLVENAHFPFTNQSIEWNSSELLSANSK